MSELIKQFGVDWRLLLAQALNFAVLIFVLAKFVYRPVLAMLKKRRDDIEKGIRFTKAAEESMARMDIERRKKIAEAEADAFKIVSAAENAAKQRKEEIAAEAAKKSEAVVAEARRVIAEEKAKMKDEAYAGAEDLIRAGIARVLGKMPAKDRDAALIREAMRELKTIAGQP